MTPRKMSIGSTSRQSHLGARRLGRFVALGLLSALVVGVAPIVAQGPDVFVSELPDTRKYGQVGSTVAYAIATESCNSGDEDLNWIANTNDHPVIAQNLYRMKDGGFEQLGMSWLKHGFFAVNANDCGLDCDPPGGFGGDALGPGCSDPYDVGLNGQQTGLGPRFEVNATTGQFFYPFSFQNETGDAVYKRLQVQEADLRPAANPDALYFIEGQYVARDDAASGNGLNNASYRRVSVDSNLNLDFEDPTRPGRPAIYAWQEFDPSVLISESDVDEDGRFTVASRAEDLGNGRWRYNYAVHNLNSHRSASGLNIPVAPGVDVTAPTFSDVDYHSGEPYDGTDWSVQLPDGSDRVRWSTESFDVNEDANALRWGTMYSFSFEADRPPVATAATIELFRPGSAVDPMSTVLAPADDLSCGGAFNLSLNQGELTAGEPVTLSVVGALPGELVRFIRGSEVGCGLCPDAIGGLCLEVAASVRELGSVTADAGGRAELTVTLPAGLPTGELVTQAVIQRGGGGSESVKSQVVVDTISGQ